jgi:hypothetical protein
MRYEVVRNEVKVVGILWMGARAAMTYYPNCYQVADAEGKVSRESVQAYLDKYAGDFQRILDFSADIAGEVRSEDVVVPWANEVFELEYCGLVCPMDEDGTVHTELSSE